MARASGDGPERRGWNAARTLWREARDPAVVRRALRYAAVVGAILIAVNQGDAILAGRIGPPELAKMALTVTVPYLVSTFSSVGALRTLRSHNGGEQPPSPR